MIEFIEGRICSLTPVGAVLQTGGVGFYLNITVPTYEVLCQADEARLMVHEAIREDSWTLYGFATEAERDMFRLLLGVSGVGANTARMILSAITAQDLGVVISQGDARRIKSVKGVGTKTAERIIVDLRDKIKAGDSTLLMQTPAMGDAFDESLAAMLALGFPRVQAQKVLKKLFESQPGIKVEQAVRTALSMM